MNRPLLIILVAVVAFLGGLAAGAAVSTAMLASQFTPEPIKLPASELAKPPDTTASITLEIDASGKMTVGDKATSLAELNSSLLDEALRRAMTDYTIILTADQDLPTSTVQDVIKNCQAVGFEKFVLRAH